MAPDDVTVGVTLLVGVLVGVAILEVEMDGDGVGLFLCLSLLLSLLLSTVVDDDDDDDDEDEDDNGNVPATPVGATTPPYLTITPSPSLPGRSGMPGFADVPPVIVITTAVR